MTDKIKIRPNTYDNGIYEDVVIKNEYGLNKFDFKILLANVNFNDGYYLEVMLDVSLPYVDNVVILDAGSNDNSEEIIQEYSKKYPGKIHFQKISKFGHRPDEYSSEWVKRHIGIYWNEIDARNYLYEWCDEIGYDWLVICDSDEIWNPKYFDILKSYSGSSGVITTYVKTMIMPFLYDNRDIMHKYSPKLRTFKNGFSPRHSYPKPNIGFQLHTQPNKFGRFDICEIPKDFLDGNYHHHYHHSFGFKAMHKSGVFDILNADYEKIIKSIKTKELSYANSILGNIGEDKYKKWIMDRNLEIYYNMDKIKEFAFKMSGEKSLSSIKIEKDDKIILEQRMIREWDNQKNGL